MGSFSIWHWLIVLVIVMLVFGTKKLRNIGQDLGGAVEACDRDVHCRLAFSHLARSSCSRSNSALASRFEKSSALSPSTRSMPAARARRASKTSLHATRCGSSQTSSRSVSGRSYVSFHPTQPLLGPSGSSCSIRARRSSIPCLCAGRRTGCCGARRRRDRLRIETSPLAAPWP